MNISLDKLNKAPMILLKTDTASEANCCQRPQSASTLYFHQPAEVNSSLPNKETFPSNPLRAPRIRTNSHLGIRTLEVLVIRIMTQYSSPARKNPTTGLCACWFLFEPLGWFYIVA